MLKKWHLSLVISDVSQLYCKMLWKLCHCVMRASAIGSFFRLPKTAKKKKKYWKFVKKENNKYSE